MRTWTCSVSADLCAKIEKVGKTIVTCLLPLHHPAVSKKGQIVQIHEGILAGKRYEWVDDGDEYQYHNNTS